MSLCYTVQRDCCTPPQRSADTLQSSMSQINQGKVVEAERLRSAPLTT